MSSAPAPARNRRSNPIGVLVRVVVITVAFAILGGGIGVLMGIVGISIINLAGERTDMGMALFVGALPGLVIGAVVGLIVVIRSERNFARERS